MKKQQLFISIILLMVAISCSVNNNIPLKKVDPKIYNGWHMLSFPTHGHKLKARDTLYYIKSNVERNLLLSLILRYPYEDVFYSKEYVDPFSTSKKPFSRFHDYKAKRLRRFSTEKRNEVLYYKLYDKERINRDLLAFMSFSKFDLNMYLHNINFFDSAEVYGLTCKDTLRKFCYRTKSGPFTFYNISTDFKFNYNGDSIFHDFAYKSRFYNPFQNLKYGTSDSTKSLKKERYIIAFNQDVKENAGSDVYQPHSCSKEILYLSKEFLKYEESVNYLRRVMQDYFNPEDPGTYIPYLQILAYSDYEGKCFEFIKKNKKRIRYKFYSEVLKSYMEATITIAYPQSVKFKLLKNKN